MPPIHIESRVLSAPDRTRATALLSQFIAKHATLRRGDLERAAALVAAEMLRASRPQARRLEADRAALAASCARLQRMSESPARFAEERLDALLHLVGGPLSTVEIDAERVVARALIERGGRQEARIALVLDPVVRRRMILQVRQLSGGGDFVAPCYGSIGDWLIQDALDAVDLAELFLVALGYLHTNLRAAA